MNIAEKTLSLIAPHNCIMCGNDGSLLCGWCRPDACLSLPSRCYHCRALTRDFAVCSSCRPQSKLKSVWIRADYDSYAKQLIQWLKFSRAIAAAPIIANLMTETLPYLPRDTLVIHIPTAMNRRRQRGYDQAKLLAKDVSQILGLKHSSLLLRSGKSRQVGASRKQRLEQLEQLEQAFTLKKPGCIRNQEILLVDDIVTTGATLEAAAKILKHAGAKRINAVAFAQKL